jgi:hypothetical protein
MTKFILFFAAAFALILLSKSAIPFQLTTDMGYDGRQTKKIEIPDRNEYGYIRYTDKTRDFLKQNSQDLLDFSCTDAFYRTDQGVYILEKIKTRFMERRRVQNEDFLSFMREREPELPRGTKFLTARACKVGVSILLFYTIGKYDIKLADSLTAQNAIVYSNTNTALVDIFTEGLFKRTLTVSASDAHVRCDQPLQITKDKKTTVFCTEEKDWFANYYVYELNLKDGERREVEECVNNFEGGLVSICE